MVRDPKDFVPFICCVYIAGVTDHPNDLTSCCID